MTNKTICLDGKITYKDGYTKFFNMHNIYGYSEAKPSLDACREVTGKRCMVISRSTFPGTAKYAQHWLGDNLSIWRHLKQSVIGKLKILFFFLNQFRHERLKFPNEGTFLTFFVYDCLRSRSQLLNIFPYNLN